MKVGSSVVRRHTVIAGRVQGVNFRNTAKQVADQVGVRGWVKNLPDGKVEAVFEGPREAIERMLVWCRHGPPNARVETIDVTMEPPTGEFMQFRVLR